MKDNLYLITLLLVIGLMIFLGISWEVYRYKDCRKVGHTKLYCALSK